MSVKDLQAGQKITFKGYPEGTAENEQLLEAGAEYVIAEVDAKENKVSVEIDNPDFNAKKPVNADKNPKTYLVEVFEEEFDVVEEAAAEEAAPAPAAKGRTRPAAAAAAKPAVAQRPTGTAPKAAAAKPAAKAVAAKPGKAAPAPAAAEPEQEEDAEADVEILEEQDAEIAALVEQAGDGLLDLAQEIATESASTDYRLGGILYNVRITKAFESLDEKYTEKGGFGLYVKENLNVEYRKAMYLVNIYIAANKYGIAPETIARIGWTKAAKISEVMDADNAADLVKLAEGNTVSDLVENIKASYKEVGGQKGEKKRMIIFKFRAFEDQAELIQAAIEGCANSLGLKGTKALDQAFEHIVTEWATEHPVSAPAKVTTGRKVTAPATAKPAVKGAAKPAVRPAARPAARAAA